MNNIRNKISDIKSKLNNLEHLLEAENTQGTPPEETSFFQRILKLLRGAWKMIFGGEPDPKAAVDKLKNTNPKDVLSGAKDKSEKPVGSDKDQEKNIFQLGSMLSSARNVITEFFKSLKPDKDKKGIFAKTWNVLTKLWNKLYGLYDKAKQKMEEWKPAVGSIFTGVVFLASAFFILIYFVAGDADIEPDSGMRAPAWLPDVVEAPLNMFFSLLTFLKSILVNALDTFIQKPEVGVMFAAFLGLSYYSFSVGWYEIQQLKKPATS